KRRLNGSARSNSRLLELGREAYRNADETVLAMLQGLDCVPVHRNNGIDALLKHEFDGGPVPVRVQRPGETLRDAAFKLSKACAGKGAKLMFVVALARGGTLEFADELPPGVIAVDSPALSIRDHLDRRKNTPRPSS
ncbi:MAG: site-specific DNA-methyltransferase, partial [Planctomycetia bacterium]|nr:site-specific DNA-methyltransferase [Planctomycetia bacterium]